MRKLERVAHLLAAAAPARKGARAVPSLVFVTDPLRTPDPAAVAERLPAGAVVILRSFGRPDAREQAQVLREITRRNGLRLLIGADAELAEAVAADGVHLPERALADAPILRARHPVWLITGAAHSEAALARAGDARLDAALVSPVFASGSPSAGEPLGLERLAAWVGKARLPVLALGGVDARTAPQLLGTGVAGLAAVEGFASAALRT